MCNFARQYLNINDHIVVSTWSELTRESADIDGSGKIVGEGRLVQLVNLKGDLEGLAYRESGSFDGANDTRAEFKWDATNPVSRRMPVGVHSEERTGTATSHEREELVEARTTSSFVEPLWPTSVKIASSREGLIKSKRPIRRGDKDAGLSTGGFVSSVPNTEAYTGAAAMRPW